MINYYYEIDDKNLNPPLGLAYNYGQIDEIVVTPPYDSLIVNEDFENYVIFDFVNQDTSIIEVRFQIHLTKPWCHTFDSGVKTGCDIPPYYEVGEPMNILITNDEFRLQRK